MLNLENIKKDHPSGETENSEKDIKQPVKILFLVHFSGNLF